MFSLRNKKIHLSYIARPPVKYNFEDNSVISVNPYLSGVLPI